MILSFIPEDKGLDYTSMEDEYTKYDPEESADELLINSEPLGSTQGSKMHKAFEYEGIMHTTMLGPASDFRIP